MASNQSVYEVVTTPRHSRGTRGILADGRTFEYCRSDDATQIVKATLAVYDPVDAALDVLSIQAAVAIGDTSIPVTVTETIVANELAGSYISIEENVGEGELYRILGHAAHTSGTLTLEVDRTVVVAMTTSTRATIIFNANQIQVSATVAARATPVEAACGVPLVTIPVGSTDAQFAWVQKTGIATVLFGTAVGAVGQGVYQGENAGSFQLAELDIVTTVDIPSKVLLGTIAALLPIDTQHAVVYLQIA